jgi:hypothetical protein
MKPLFSTLRKYERHLSAIAMVIGFAFDNYFFGRVDHPATQIALFVYIVVAIGSILFIHFIEMRAKPEGPLQKAHPFLVVATQFAFGGLWSAFLIFYGRSAVVSASWPFLIVLAGILVGNEMFRKYRARLVFTCTLLFFALFSYTIFVVPVFTGTVGRGIFLLSGILAIAIFCLFLLVLLLVGAERLRSAWREIAMGAAGVFAAINLFYFSNILPPLPLALERAGVFHSVTRVGADYQAVAEPNPWYSAMGTTPVVHTGAGEPIYLYSAVFAPIQLRTSIVHVWQLYDSARGWQSVSVVRFPITGGRDGGYRGYSIKSDPAPGRWRVDIETSDGLLIGRIPFFVQRGLGSAKSVQILK